MGSSFSADGSCFDESAVTVSDINARFGQGRSKLKIQMTASHLEKLARRKRASFIMIVSGTTLALSSFITLVQLCML